MAEKRFMFSISALITITLALLLVFFSLFSLFSQLNRLNSYSLQSRNAETFVAIENLKNAIIESQGTFSDYLNTKNTYKLIDYHKATNEAENAVRRIEELIDGNVKALFSISAIKESFASYLRKCDSTLENFGLSQTQYYRLKQEADRIAAYIGLYTDELLSLVIESNTEALARDAESYSLFIAINFAVLISFALILIAIIYIFSRHISRPLKALSDTAMEISEGNLNARAATCSMDRQVNLLTDTFNNMADDIVKMMDDLMRKIDAEKKLLDEQKKNLEVQAQLDRATFLALQTQTNPHFLFNTLNTIDRTIQLGNSEDARKMLHSISTLMRYNLSDSSIPAVLREEADITKEYLEIQKMRFSERLNYEIDISEELLDTVFMPRFTLQPLVENAIIHGLKTMESNGMVRISAKAVDGKDIILSIEDNGAGMSREKIEESLRREWNESKHIGLSNTMHRIELFMESKDAFSIESEIGKGTVINIRLRRQ